MFAAAVDESGDRLPLQNVEPPANKRNPSSQQKSRTAAQTNSFRRTRALTVCWRVGSDVRLSARLQRTNVCIDNFGGESGKFWVCARSTGKTFHPCRYRSGPGNANDVSESGTSMRDVSAPFARVISMANSSLRAANSSNTSKVCADVRSANSSAGVRSDVDSAHAAIRGDSPQICESKWRRN